MIAIQQDRMTPGLFGAPPAAVQEQAGPTIMGRLFVAVLLIAVFEGAIRKWISTDYTTALVMFRDCLAVYGVFWAIRNGKMQSVQTGWHILFGWSCLVFCWASMQLAVNQYSPLVLIVGLRFWLLYLWFAFAAAVSFTEADFRHAARVILWLLALMTPLAVVQFYLSPSDFLNKQLDDDETAVFRVTADIVRTSGTFSFALGYSTFLATANPFVFARLAPGDRFAGRAWLSGALFLLLSVATVVSGARAALLLFAIMFAVLLVVTVLYSLAKRRPGGLLGMLAVVLALAAVTTIFSDAVNAMRERVELAAEAEDFSERVETMFIGESVAYEELPMIGNGIGSGSNFAAVEAIGVRAFMLAETETARTLLEGGLIGFVFIALKLAVVFLGVKQSVRIVRSSGDALPLLLWCTLAIGLLSWSIIGQLTVNVLGYLLLGLGIASLRLAASRQ